MRFLLTQNLGYTHVSKHKSSPITLVNIIFAIWKVICASYVFFDAEFKYVIRTALSPTVFVWQNILQCNFS